MLFLLLVLLPTVSLGNILKNADFESSTFSQSAGWWCLDCTASLSSDRHSGSHSVKVTNRGHGYSGITQTFPAHAGQKYYFRAYVKLLNTAQGKMYHTMDTYLEIKMQNGQSKYEVIGNTPHIKPGEWHIVGGDYQMPSGFKEVRVYFQVAESQVNYLLDSAVIDTVHHISNLKSDTNGGIDKYRKANINIKVTDHHVNPSGLTIDVQQTSSEFGFGSAVDARYIVDPHQKKYQDYFYDNFEWAVLENALKWYSMEPQQGQNNVQVPENAINALRSHGIKVRGHNIFWAVPEFAPSWQKSLSASALKQEMVYRFPESIKHFAGKLPHWDVNNENLHGDFYAQKLHDPDITQWMFREAHKSDPACLLFLNDYDIVSGHSHTVALEDQAKYLLSKGVPVHRIGIQSHIRGGVDVDLIKHRLDEVAKAGLKMWITELDVDDSNENSKADKYEELLRLYFGHPAIEGVLLWGFWDQKHWRPHAAIATGNNVTPNAAGRRIKGLIKGEWRTHESHAVKEGQTVRIRGFKGSYTVNVKHNGHVIKTQHFYLGGNGASLTISLSGSGNNPHVSNILIG